jgi:hypothetical protein
VAESKAVNEGAFPARKFTEWKSLVVAGVPFESGPPKIKDLKPENAATPAAPEVSPRLALDTKDQASAILDEKEFLQYLNGTGSWTFQDK